MVKDCTWRNKEVRNFENVPSIVPRRTKLHPHFGKIFQLDQKFPHKIWNDESIRRNHVRISYNLRVYKFFLKIKIPKTTKERVEKFFYRKVKKKNKILHGNIEQQQSAKKNDKIGEKL